MDKKFIDVEMLIDELSASCMPIFEKGISGILGDEQSIADVIREQPAADVQEKKDCEKCIHFSRHATEYPCNYCRNCYTDKFQPMPNCGARMDLKQK